MSRHAAEKLTPEQRVEQLRGRLHHEALKRLLGKGEKIIPVYTLESNRGRMNKAGNDLVKSGDAYFAGTTGDSWRSNKGYWTDSLDAHLQGYAKLAPPKGEAAVRKHVERYMDRRVRTNDYGEKAPVIDTIGWQCIVEADIGTLAHAWANRGDYLFQGMKGKEDDYDRKPDGRALAWEECHQPGWFIHRDVHAEIDKYILRNMVEHYAETMYDYLSRSDTGLKGWSDQARLVFNVSNVGWSEPCPQNVDTAIGECRIALERLTEYLEGCKRLRGAVEALGGSKPYHRELLERAIRDMLVQAPVAVATGRSESKESELVTYGRIDNMVTVSKYILSRAGLMDYGRLFDDREGVVKLTADGSEESNTLDGAHEEKVLDRVAHKVLVGKEGGEYMV